MPGPSRLSDIRVCDCMCECECEFEWGGQCKTRLHTHTLTHSHTHTLTRTLTRTRTHTHTHTLTHSHTQKLTTGADSGHVRGRDVRAAWAPGFPIAHLFARPCPYRPSIHQQLSLSPIYPPAMCTYGTCIHQPCVPIANLSTSLVSLSPIYPPSLCHCRPSIH